jgi:tetratricopeptide (TPR) repeat protein
MRAVALLFAGLLACSSTVLAATSKEWSECEGDNIDRAIAACSKIIAQGKESRTNLALAYSDRGKAYVDKGDYDRAIADLGEAIKINPKEPVPYYNRALAHQNKGEDDAAIADVSRSIELQPNDADAYKLRADSYANKGKQAEAIADYGEAIKRKSDFADAYYGRGLAYFAEKDYDRSLADCDRAIALKPGDAEAHTCRADDLAGKDDYDGAIASFDKAIELAGKDVWGGVHRGRADSLSNKGEFDQAIAGYDQALRLDPKDAEALKNRGITRCNNSDYAQGIADLAAASELDPKMTDVHNARAYCLLKQGEVDKALSDAERGVAAEPDDAAALDTRGTVYMQKGLLDLALADFDKSLALDPTLIEVYRDRGLAYQQTGDREKAVADFRKGLALKPRWVMERRAQDEVLQHLTNLAATSPPDRTTTPQPSSPPQAPEKRIALVIGNGAYTNVRALKNADADARAVAASLRGLGFEVVEKHDLDFPALVSELKDFGDQAPQYDWALVYYAGHGIEVGGVNYLIPVDAELANANHVEDEAIPLDRVLAKVEGAQKLRLVILDACRENPFIAKMASAGGTRSIGRGLARIEPSGGVLVAYSARDGQVAQDGDGNNSPFAQALLDHLGEPGLEINMLFRKVRDDVKSKTGGVQEPFTYGSLPAEALYFKAARN